jgi:hypothetical protein
MWSKLGMCARSHNHPTVPADPAASVYRDHLFSRRGPVSVNRPAVNRLWLTSPLPKKILNLAPGERWEAEFHANRFPFFQDHRPLLATAANRHSRSCSAAGFVPKDRSDSVALTLLWLMPLTVRESLSPSTLRAMEILPPLFFKCKMPAGTAALFLRARPARRRSGLAPLRPPLVKPVKQTHDRRGEFFKFLPSCPRRAFFFRLRSKLCREAPADRTSGPVRRG